MMIESWQVQNDLRARLLTISWPSDAVVLAGNILEDFYQGRDFGYPAIRLDMRSFLADHDADQCDITLVRFSLHCYGEGSSSLVADKVAGACNNNLHKSQFLGTEYQIPRLRSDGLIAAERIDEKLWRATAMFSGNAYAGTTIAR